MPHTGFIVCACFAWNTVIPLFHDIGVEDKYKSGINREPSGFKFNAGPGWSSPADCIWQRPIILSTYRRVLSCMCSFVCLLACFFDWCRNEAAGPCLWGQLPIAAYVGFQLGLASGDGPGWAPQTKKATRNKEQRRRKDRIGKRWIVYYYVREVR